jgi:hypothetical protein
MWKPLLDRILGSCVYMDPMAYMYYVTTKREGEVRADQERMVSRSIDAPTPAGGRASSVERGAGLT